MAFGRRARPWLLGLALRPFATGCAFGTYVLESSDGRYHESVKRVEGEEFLRNLVRLRYSDSWSNPDVTAITAQHELGAFAQTQPFFLAQSSNGLFKSFNQVLPFGNINGTNSPAISLQPAHDATFLSVDEGVSVVSRERDGAPRPTSNRFLVMMTEPGVFSYFRPRLNCRCGIPRLGVLSGDFSQGHSALPRGRPRCSRKRSGALHAHPRQGTRLMWCRYWWFGIALVGTNLGCGLAPRHFQALADPSPLARARAVGLGKNMPDSVVIPALIDRLNDRDPVVRLSANEELRRRTSQDFGYVAWAKPEAREHAAGQWRAWWQTQQKAALANSRPMP